MSAWSDVMSKESKDTRHRPNSVANDLLEDEVVTIMATAEFFGASDRDLAQIHFDLLGWPRYRVFDWLAMAVMGRLECRTCVRVFVHSFLKVDGDVDAFIQDLRETDYDIDESWKTVELEEES